MRMSEKTGWQMWIVYNKEVPEERGGRKSRKNFCCDEYEQGCGAIAASPRLFSRPEVSEKG